MDENTEVSSSKGMAKGKRKLQTRKGSKLLQMQAKAASDSESDTGGHIIYYSALPTDDYFLILVKSCIY